jgi:uncharacterized sulfatase
MSIVSGQYPSRHEVWTNGICARDDQLSLPQILAEQAGYRTALIGKSHFRPGRPTDIDTHDWVRSPRDGSDLTFEALPYDWDFFRRWSGPWHGFQHAKLNTGHAFNRNAYSMHYAAWLEDRGIPCEPPWFFDGNEAKAQLAEQLSPSLATFADMPSDGPVPPPVRWELPDELHHSAWVADEVISYLGDHVSSHGDEPFFISADFPDPHSPFVVPEPWASMYEGAEIPPVARREGEWANKPAFYRALLEGNVLDGGWHKHHKSVGPVPLMTPEARTPRELRWWWTYMGMQSLVDHNLGRMLDELDRLGLAENTLVIFTSDHGDMMGDHYLWHKGGNHYDGCARVPLLVRWPGHVPAGTQSSSLQSLVDLAPTIMAAAGLEPRPEMQGVDQRTSWCDPEETVRKGVLVEHRIEHYLDLNSWITDRYRLSIYSDLAHNRDELELYDLQEDPDEFQSLADDPSHKGTVVELLAEAWRNRSQAEYPLRERVSSGMH